MNELDWAVDLNNIPTYTVTEVARYLHLPTVTLSTWVNGRTYTTNSGKHTTPPIIERPNPKTPLLSFNNLPEAHILRVLREGHGIPLKNVRSAIDHLSAQFDTAHPLIHHRFSTDGINLFIEQADLLINLSRAGQLAIRELLRGLLDRIEWEGSLPVRLYPQVFPITANTADKMISIDTRYSFGKPIITDTGVPTYVLAELYNAGDSIEDLAADYECTPAQVNAAVRFESFRKRDRPPNRLQPKSSVTPGGIGGRKVKSAYHNDNYSLNKTSS